MSKLRMAESNSFLRLNCSSESRRFLGRGTGVKTGTEGALASVGLDSAGFAPSVSALASFAGACSVGSDPAEASGASDSVASLFVASLAVSPSDVVVGVDGLLVSGAVVFVSVSTTWPASAMGTSVAGGSATGAD